MTVLLLLLVGAGGCRHSSLPNTGNTAGDILFADAFTPGQSGPWQLEADAAGTTAIEDERLIISIQEANTLQYATLREPDFTDFSLEVDATFLDGPVNGSYGVLFRIQDAGGFYRFNITGDGYYTLDRLNGDGSWTPLLPNGWAESAAIKSGLRATNRLKVVVGGPNMILYVNGERLGQFTDAMG